MAGKYSKDEVDYSPGTNAEHCGICDHFRAGKCTEVEGNIAPSYWCTEFEKSLRGTIREAAQRR